jgi:predicted nucleic acid-binding protein
LSACWKKPIRFSHPPLIISEVVNTIWKYHQFENLNLNTCDQAIEFALGLLDVLVPTKELYREAFLLARSARQSAYDMFYLALARRGDAGFLTLDGCSEKKRSGKASAFCNRV